MHDRTHTHTHRSKIQVEYLYLIVVRLAAAGLPWEDRDRGLQTERVVDVHFLFHSDW